ncbi:MAG: hypothetical protein OXF02_04210 [Simkaniaceae bacterium]|nr:hypothetical protein [Simkaniaceae bacterium]
MSIHSDEVGKTDAMSPVSSRSERRGDSSSLGSAVVHHAHLCHGIAVAERVIKNDLDPLSLGDAKGDGITLPEQIDVLGVMADMVKWPERDHTNPDGERLFNGMLDNCKWYMTKLLARDKHNPKAQDLDHEVINALNNIKFDVENPRDCVNAVAKAEEVVRKRIAL